MLAQRLGVSNVVKVIPHEGKADLEGSVARKIRGWRAATEPRFIVTRDGTDSARDVIKARLFSLVPAAALPRTRIRIVVHELESWFLGDPDALARSNLLRNAVAERRARQLARRDLCALSNPAQELDKIVAIPGKIARARAIAPHMNLDHNSARSFAPFMSALRWATA